MPRERTPMLIGIGNEDRGDDGVGLHVVRAFSRAYPHLAEVVEPLGDSTDLLDIWEGASLVIVVDAVRSGKHPGTVIRLDAEKDPLQKFFPLLSSHSLSLAQAIGLGESMQRMPRKLVILGVEAGSLASGNSLTPAVQKAVQKVVERIAKELQEDEDAGVTEETEVRGHA